MKDLKEKTIRGGMARLAAQGANFSIRLVSLVILARLLDPKDFGLVGMVTAFTGVLTLIRDFGLSAAAIHRPNISEDQFSNLFWINMVVGCLIWSHRTGRVAGDCRLLSRASTCRSHGGVGACICF